MTTRVTKIAKIRRLPTTNHRGGAVEIEEFLMGALGFDDLGGGFKCFLEFNTKKGIGDSFGKSFLGSMLNFGGVILN